MKYAEYISQQPQHCQKLVNFILSKPRYENTARRIKELQASGYEFLFTVRPLMGIYLSIFAYTHRPGKTNIVHIEYLMSYSEYNTVINNSKE